MEENMIKVYIQVDSNNVITQVDSSIYVSNVEGWVKIDEGQGDKYSHAQGNYFSKGLIDCNNKYNYKLVDNKPVELTEEEKEKLFPTKALEPSEIQILEKQLLETQATLANLQIDILLKQNGGM